MRAPQRYVPVEQNPSTTHVPFAERPTPLPILKPGDKARIAGVNVTLIDLQYHRIFTHTRGSEAKTAGITQDHRLIVAYYGDDAQVQRGWS